LTETQTKRITLISEVYNFTLILFFEKKCGIAGEKSNHGQQQED